jgi:hypothetical protein
MASRREGAGLFEVINLSGDSHIFTDQFLKEAVVLYPYQLYKKKISIH